MARRNIDPNSHQEQERQIRLEQANLEPLPIIEKINELKEKERKDELTCPRDKCRCKCNKDNKPYRED